MRFIIFLMVLDTTECIQINNNGRVYTDCMEFSLLRFIQLIGHNPKKINKEGWTEYIDKAYCDMMKLHIKAYPKIYLCGNYYLEQEFDGPNERESWAEFLSDRDFLDYYRNDQAELFTSVSNIIKFFNGFYDLNLDIGKPEKSIKQIAKYFSTKKIKISFDIDSVITNERKMSMKDIFEMLSRPDNEIKPDKKHQNIIIKNTILNISINNTKYKWKLYEVYFKDSTLFSNSFITGHSVIEKIY